ncbi:MAG TPA: hypothetical protein VLC98_12220 [Phnomibacter sp.]|nr:hypothetical protein [Phnomibacter sp.]
MSLFAKKIKHALEQQVRKRMLSRRFHGPVFRQIQWQNRNSLSLVNKWIEEETLNSSVFRYGISPGMESLLDETIDANITYTDIMLFLSKRLQAPIHYLEIGVSVGKNLFQVLNVLENAFLVGMDIEAINPTLANRLVFEEKKIWKGKSQLKQTECSLTKFSYRSNNCWYLNIDEFDAESWNKLNDLRFNIIFSDALHDPKALHFEFEMLQRHNLLDPNEILMVWDDLGGEMTNVFNEIYEVLRLKYTNLKKFQFVTNGWMNLKVHHVGIITTADL